MRDDELLLKSLKNIKNQLADERADIKRTDKLNSQIAAEYDDAIKKLDKILPKIKSVLDIYYVESEEDFVFVIELLESYSETFIVDGRNEEKKKRDEAEFAQLQNIISEFYDDDDEEDEDSENENSDDENLQADDDNKS